MLFYCLFIEKDLSRVKRLLERNWTKILAGTVHVPDYIFAKEVRGVWLNPPCPLLSLLA